MRSNGEGSWESLPGRCEGETAARTDLNDMVCLRQGSTNGEEGSKESRETHDGERNGQKYVYE